MYAAFAGLAAITFAGHAKLMWNAAQSSVPLVYAYAPPGIELAVAALLVLAILASACLCVCGAWMSVRQGRSGALLVMMTTAAIAWAAIAQTSSGHPDMAWASLLAIGLTGAGAAYYATQIAQGRPRLARSAASNS